MVVYVFFGQFYFYLLWDLKCLEFVERSLLFQQFGEILSGVIIIWVYGDECCFIRDNFVRINKQLCLFIYFWVVNRWFVFRIDLLGDFVVFFVGVFVIISFGQVDLGFVGILLSYVIGFVDNIFWLVCFYVMNE